MKKLVVYFCLLLALILPAPILAGGGLISWLEVTPSGILNPGEQFIVRPQVRLPNDDPYDQTVKFCQGCPIKIKLENPQSTDIINQSSEITDENGTLYAKVISKIPGKRYIFAEVTLPDSKFTKEEKTNLYKSSYLVLNYLGETQWEPIYESNPPTIIAQPAPSCDGTECIATIKEPTEVIVNSPIPLLYPGNVENFDTLKPIPSDFNQMDELNEKISNLENQLEESKKKQSLLEEKVNQLVNFIKSLFPFFN